jgi:hypothetical protein
MDNGITVIRKIKADKNKTARIDKSKTDGKAEG